MFLTQIDYDAHLKGQDLLIITKGNNQASRDFAEKAAVKEIKSYLSNRFDVDLLFIDTDLWDAIKNYLIGDQVTFDDAGTLKIYVALTDSLGASPDINPLDWEEEDNRDELLVMRTVDVTTFHLYAKVPNRNTPEDVSDRYIDSIDWFKGVSNGMYNPEYPILEEDDETTTNESQTGTDEKKEWTW